MKAKRVLVWTVVVLAAVVVAGNLWLNRYIEALAPRLLRDATGMDLTYEKAEVFPWQFALRLTGLTFPNPEGFPKGEALRFSEVYAALHPSSLWRREKHFREVRLVAERIHVVRNNRGRINLEIIAKAIEDASKAPAASPAATAPVTSAPAATTPAPVDPGAAPAGPAASAPRPPPPAEPEERPLRIDTLIVKAKDAEFLDYTDLKDGQPSRRTFEIAFDRTLQNVTDLDDAGAELFTDLVLEVGPKLLISRENLDAVAQQLGISAEEAEAGMKLLLKGLSEAFKKPSKKAPADEAQP